MKRRQVDPKNNLHRGGLRAGVCFKPGERFAVFHIGQAARVRNWPIVGVQIERVGRKPMNRASQTHFEQPNETAANELRIGKRAHQTTSSSEIEAIRCTSDSPSLPV